tara:strand:- start:19018 stop:20268 length:1251 start_codon:yes stop_codon:yes gene_type:complete
MDILKLQNYFFSSSSFLILGQVFFSFTNISLAIFISSFWDLGYFGFFSFYLLVSVLISKIITASLIEPAVSISAKYSWNKKMSYFRGLLIWFLIISIIFFLLGFYMLPILKNIFNVSDYLTNPKILFFLFSSFLIEINRGGIQAFSKAKYLFTFDCLRFLIFISVMIYFLLRFNFSGTPNAFQEFVMFITIINIFLGTALFILVLSGGKGLKSYIKPSSKQLLMSRNAVTIAVLNYSHVNAPLYFAQLLLGQELFGLIRLCQSLANATSLPFRAMRYRLMSSGSSVNYERGNAGLKVFILERLRVIFILSFFVGSLIFLISFFGDIEEISKDFLIILFLFILVSLSSVVSGTLLTTFYSKGELNSALLMMFSCALISLIISPILIFALGEFGVPISKIIILCIVTLYAFKYLQREI